MELTHRCPPGRELLTPCCGRSPFDLPVTDRMTVEPVLVTCKGLKATPLAALRCGCVAWAEADEIHVEACSPGHEPGLEAAVVEMAAALGAEVAIASDRQ